MKINKATQLWEELTPKDIVEMRKWAEEAVLHGRYCFPDPPWLELWYSELGYDKRQQIMLQSIGVTQRILLSIVKAMSLEIRKLERGIMDLVEMTEMES